VIKDIEDDNSPGGMNQHNITLPRLKDNLILWVWREDGCLNDVDMELIYKMFLSRLAMITYCCDPNYETVELLATLFLEYVV